MRQVRRALELGVNAPKLTMEGFGGTYFMYDPRKRPLACFKPADEEPYAPNNPRGPELVADWGMVGKELFSMRPGVRPGEGYLREVASHLLDHGGFAGVPATTVVEARHPAFHYLVRAWKEGWGPCLCWLAACLPACLASVVCPGPDRN